MPATPDAAADATSSDESGALGVLNAINDHEIAAGEQALSKGVTGAVAEYAQMMIDQHSDNRSKTTALGPDPSAPAAETQKQKGETELSMLDAMSGDAYAKAYIDAMVKGHADALAALDTQLIPAATRPEVRDHFATTRDHVADHHERAKALQAE